MSSVVAPREELAPVVSEFSLPELPSPEATDHAFGFRGDTREYFRIWIVNVALTIVTLGVYSAWAKVRTERWFYANTWVAGAPFQYLAKPIPILVGRIIAFVLFASYALAARFWPGAELVVLGVIAIVMPVLVVRGLRFRARYSAWRGLNFRFEGRVGEAYVRFLVAWLIVPLTLGFGYAWVKAAQKRYIVEHHRYGGHRFRFAAKGEDFFGVYFAAGAMVAGAVAILTMSMGAIVQMQSMALFYAALVMLYGAYFAAFVFVAARVANLVYNNTAIAEHRFRSDVRAHGLAGIYLSNTVAILVSVGLLIPWAMIRLARYRAAHLVLVARGDLDAFVAESRASEGAAGLELADAFDVDIGV
jgi:uncharacterized membrane protein YjgN (DUF898 family)